MACLPISDLYCVPPAYQQAWIPGGILLRGDQYDQPGPSAQAAARVGASIDMMNTDLPTLTEVWRFQRRRIGDRILLYRARCEGLTCVYQASVMPAGKPLPARTFAPELKVTGVTAEGLGQAQRTIRVRVGPPSRWVRLSALKPARD